MTAVSNLPPPLDARPRGLRRVLGGVAAALGLLVTFAAAFVVGLVLHLELPSARRVVVAQVNSVLASVFHGRLTVVGVEHVGLHGADGVSARVVDDDGVTVIVAEGIRGRVSVVDLVRTALAGAGDLRVVISGVEIDSADVNLDTREDGRTRLESAFEPRAKGEPPGRPVFVDLPEILVKRARAHGRPPAFPQLDADVVGVRGSVHVAPGSVHVDVTGVDVVARGMARGANPVGAGDTRVVVPSPSGRTFEVVSSFHGTVGGVPASASFFFDGVHLDGLLDVPLAHASSLRSMLPEVPLDGELAARLDVHGDLPRLGVRARASLGEADVGVRGEVTLGGAPSGTLNIDTTGLDLRAFVPTAPPSSVDATARIAFGAPPGGAVTGDFDVELARGTLAGSALPHATAGGDYRVVPGEGTRDAEVTVHGRAHVDERGAPTDVILAFASGRGAEVLEVDARVVVPRLDGTRLGPVAGGSGRFHALGRLQFDTDTVDARIEGAVEDAQRGPLHVARAVIAAHASGALSAPVWDASVHGDGVGLGGFAFAQGTLTARGTTPALDVMLSLTGSERGPDVDARGRVTARGSELRVDGGIVEGLGEPVRLAFRRGASSLDAHIETRGLDLARLGTLLGAGDRLRGGRLALDADVTATRGAVNGTLVADLVHGAAFAAKDTSAHIDATFEGRRATVNARVAEAGMGSAELHAGALEVGGADSLDEDSWRRLWGDADLAATLDLAKLAAVWPRAGGAAFGDATGQVTLRGKVARPAGPGASPTVHVTVDTAGLHLQAAEIVQAPGGTMITEGRGLRVEGLDVHADATFDGPSSLLSLDARVVDRHGVLLALDASAPALRYRELMAADDLASALMSVPFSARLALPRRPFEELPVIGERSRGDIEASLAADGTANDPRLELLAHAYGVKSPQAAITSKLDVDLTARYAAGVTDASGAARTPKGEVLKASARVTATLADLVRARDDEPPWEASASAKLTRFPLGAIAALSDRQVRGRASGEVTVAGLHRDARASAKVDVEGLEVGGTPFDVAHVDTTLEGGALRGSARLARGPASFADLDAELGMAWGAALLPAVDRAKPVLVTLRAKKFPVSALAPLVEPEATDLDGTLDADARFSVQTGGETEARGSIVVSDGAVQITALGQAYHGIQGRLTLSPDGLLRLENARALGFTGLVMAAASARMDGLRMTAARATVRIPSSQPIPITLQGVQMGDVYGALDISAESSADGRETNIGVDVPTLRVRLPPSAPHTVQHLDEPEKLRVGMYRAPGQFVILPIDGEDLREKGPAALSSTRVNVVFKLGNDVRVERGTTLRVLLGGAPQVHVTDSVRMSGQIRLKSGTLDVQGKRFEIEKGTITFVGDDPSNPEVVVTAAWTAPDGTKVFADFTGPLKTGKVTLRSEPGRPQNEILALIMFGTAEGSSTTPYAQPAAGTATQAGTAAASGLATEGLSRGIDSLTGLDVATKVDTTDSANPRPEVELRIARDISLQVAFVIGTPPPGANPDHTFATLDWRFLRQWSLATTFGDQGSSMADVVWHHRY